VGCSGDDDDNNNDSDAACDRRVHKKVYLRPVMLKVTWCSGGLVVVG
jgi:hypothetical protein